MIRDTVLETVESVLGRINNNQNGITVNMYSPKALSEAEGARQFKKLQQKLAMG